MRKINNALAVVMVLIFCGISGYAQNNNTSSPYSRFGLGDLNPYGYGRSAAMGGAILGSRHAVQINSANPASYTANDSLSFIFDFGIDGTFSNYKSDNASRRTNDINFRYFSLSFPVTKWMGAGFGLQPFSDMGYDVGFSTIDSISGIGNTTQHYFGAGSTSKAYFGASIRPFKGLSIGANLNYIFGRLSKNTVFQFADAASFSYSKTEGIRLRDFTLTYGLQYDMQLKKNRYLTLGVTFERQSDFTILYQSLALVGGTDTILGSSEAKQIMKMPSTYGVGLSYNQVNKLEINADYYHAGWSKSSFPGKINEMVTDQDRFSAGFEYIPDAASIRSYVKRVKYRAGAHYENSYLMLNNQQINETGVSFGLGLPLPKSKSTANFAIEVGKRGTTKYDLVKNNYAKVSLYLNFYDYWFIKRKFD
ncbi:MAG TPA: hypothetical protein DCL77_13630 [Prolixibacteraceae bacterium]|jgi:hypothetical protein|nr:hypothetical protein [Prolixibacteraceae bacterium]